MPAKFPDTDLVLNKDGSIYHLSLRPKDIADNIIVVGDPGRVHRVSSHFDSVHFEMNKREFITHTGKYKGKKITVISSGIGTDNMEMLMIELDALVNIDLKKRSVRSRKKKLKLYRLGTSASIQEDLRIGSHIVTEYAVGLDPIMHFYDYRPADKEAILTKRLKEELELAYLPYCFKGSKVLLEKFQNQMVVGNTVTSPGFYAPQGRNLRLATRHNQIIDQLAAFHEEDIWLTNIEMEAAAFYAFGKLLGHEVVSMNAIIANRIRKSVSKDPNRIIDSLIKKVLDSI